MPAALTGDPAAGAIRAIIEASVRLPAPRPAAYRASLDMSKSIWKHRPTLDELREMGRDTAVERLGIEFVAVGDDHLVARMPVDTRTVQPLGLLHGGASVLLAETLGSAAAHCCIDSRTHSAVGIEINANHVRTVRSGWVQGTVRPIHLGRSTQLWETRVVDDHDRLVCISRLTTTVLEKKAQ
jgi:1,4-dihydroxy-2-naphthoyl-CoA hydrolase